MPRMLERLGRGLKSRHPTVLLGAGLLLLGMAMTVVRSRPGPAGDAALTLNTTLSEAIQLAQQALLLGDRGSPGGQLGLRSVFVSVLTEALPARQKPWLNLGANGLTTLMRDLTSPVGLTSLVCLLLVYVAVARAVDARLGSPLRPPDPETGP